MQRKKSRIKYAFMKSMNIIELCFATSGAVIFDNHKKILSCLRSTLCKFFYLLVKYIFFLKKKVRKKMG